MLKHRFVVTLVLALGLVTATSSQSGRGADWTQWRGPGRTGVSTETGLMPQWPPAGPPRVWAVSGLGAGYGAIAVVGDRIFVQGMHGGESVVSSLNRVDGTRVWARALGRAGNINSALYRLSAIAERLTKYADQDGRLIEIKDVVDDVNKMKHEVEGRLIDRSVGLDMAVAAAERIARVLEAELTKPDVAPSTSDVTRS